MDLSLILDEIKIALTKVTSGGVTKSQMENDQFAVKVYTVGGGIIRIDIKEKKGEK